MEMGEEDNPEWPREIWMAELDKHHNGTGMVVLSEFATVPRWDGDDERDCDFQKYVDADILETTERYYEAKQEEMRARIKSLCEAMENTVCYGCEYRIGDTAPHRHICVSCKSKRELLAVSK